MYKSDVSFQSSMKTLCTSYNDPETKMAAKSTDPNCNRVKTDHTPVSPINGFEHNRTKKNGFSQRNFNTQSAGNSTKMTSNELLCKHTRLKLHQPNLHTFTKEYFSNILPSQKLSSIFSKGTLAVKISIPLSSSLFRISSLVFLLLFILNNLQTSEALKQSKCETYGWSAFPVWKYRARARYVAPLKMNSEMQREFLQLFRGEKDSSEEDSSREPLYIPELTYIAEMCPKDAFFYSLSPKHLEAATALTRMFIAQPSPPEVLKLAKAVLATKQVNPKVWYHGIVGAANGRADMTGFKLAHAIDAMPDIFIPGPLLYEAMDSYRSLKRNRMGIAATNKTRIGARRSRVKSRVKRSDKIQKFLHNMNTLIIDTIKKIDKAQDSFNNTIGYEGESRAFPRSKVKRVKSSNDADNDDADEKKEDDDDDDQREEEDDEKKDDDDDDDEKKEDDDEDDQKKEDDDDDDKEEEDDEKKEDDDDDDKKKEDDDDKSSEEDDSKVSEEKPKKKKKSAKKSSKKTKKKETGLEKFFKGNGSNYTGDTGTLRREKDDAFEDCIVVDGAVGKKNGIENKLWYFREDMMVNQHHWYWHQEYPLNTSMQRPRRAELFFYMHRNLVMRYNAERLSNGLPPVEPFDIRPGAVIKTGYDSKLADVNSGKYWTPRHIHTLLTDVVHEKDPDFERNIFLGYYNKLYGRIIRSIQVGHLLLPGIKTLPIRNTHGIEPLAHTLEATELTVNSPFYDAMGFHNLGHQVIGLQADPFYEKKTPTGVMADTATTMRDPEFYSYHALVDNIFDMHKKQLPPYRPKGGEYPLKWEGVEILDVEVVSRHSGPKNQLRTFWSYRRFELTPGVDQSIHKGDVDVDVCASHLDHEPFEFKITVAFDPCAKTISNRATVRIFLAPKYDIEGKPIPLKIQRRFMINMDSFPVDLRVGRNVILRKSYDSNVVKPWSRSLKEYEEAPKHQHEADFCGCGWPTHLYIPKGTPDGMPFDLFVMLTSYDHDVVDEDPDTLSVPEPCNSPYLYCGIPWRKYPDSKPMGYPFDRLPFTVPIKCPPGPVFTTLLCKVLQLFWYKPVGSLAEYASYASNMAATVVEIRHFSHLVW